MNFSITGLPKRAWVIIIPAPQAIIEIRAAIIGPRCFSFGDASVVGSDDEFLPEYRRVREDIVDESISFARLISPPVIRQPKI